MCMQSGMSCASNAPQFVLQSGVIIFAIVHIYQWLARLLFTLKHNKVQQKVSYRDLASILQQRPRKKS